MSELCDFDRCDNDADREIMDANSTIFYVCDGCYEEFTSYVGYVENVSIETKSKDD